MLIYTVSAFVVCVVIVAVIFGIYVTHCVSDVDPKRGASLLFWTFVYLLVTFMAGAFFASSLMLAFGGSA